MKVTWARLIVAVVLAEYVRERLYLRAECSNPSAFRKAGWQQYATSRFPLALFVDNTKCHLKGWKRTQPCA